jgi:arsenate reductase (glutaredoxin)
MSVVVYGIRNCDTIKKARAWLVSNGVTHAFHDYKISGADPARLAAWADAVGWETLLNRAGTTFRTLPEEDRTDIDREKALTLMAAHPSLIKRPVVEYHGGLIVGFSPERFASLV